MHIREPKPSEWNNFCPGIGNRPRQPKPMTRSEALRFEGLMIKRVRQLRRQWKEQHTSKEAK